MDETTRVILIGGTSHVGKTTVARQLAQRPGWTWVSTDSLARHPGRPWRPEPLSVPPHVAEHYLGLTPDELIESVLSHYRNVWPLAADLIQRHAEDASTDRLVLEGSALWPESVVGLSEPRVRAIWLTSREDLFAARIRRESCYEAADPAAKVLIDKFLERTLRFDRAMMEAVRRLDLPSLDVADGSSAEDLAALCLAQMRPPSVGC